MHLQGLTNSYSCILFNCKDFQPVKVYSCSKPTLYCSQNSWIGYLSPKKFYNKLNISENELKMKATENVPFRDGGRVTKIAR